MQPRPSLFSTAVGRKSSCYLPTSYYRTATVAIWLPSSPSFTTASRPFSFPAILKTRWYERDFGAANGFTCLSHFPGQRWYRKSAKLCVSVRDRRARFHRCSLDVGALAVARASPPARHGSRLTRAVHLICTGRLAGRPRILPELVSTGNARPTPL